MFSDDGAAGAPNDRQDGNEEEAPKCFFFEDVPSAIFFFGSLSEDEDEEAGPPLVIPPLAEIAVPDWLRQPVQEDPWLTAEIAERLNDEFGPPGAWAVGVAAGMRATLWEPSLKTVRRINAAQLGGDASDPALLELSRPRSWFRGLTAEQHKTVQDLASADCDLLYARLEDLFEVLGGPPAAGDQSEDAEGWRSDWLYLCHGRAKLEAVRVLLAEAGVEPRRDILLQGLDEAASEFVAEWGERIPRFDDELLRRVFLADHLAWWGCWYGAQP